MIEMRCPKCGSYNCDIISDTETKTKGYNVGSGLCGYIVMGGPIGLLCGACGMGKTKSKTRCFGYCSDCGRRFRVRD